MQGIGNRSWLAGITLLAALMIAGCATRRGPVPVEDRGVNSPASATAPATPVDPGVPLITTDASGKPLQGIENYGKPGYYTVRPGDTIRRIASETGQSWRDISRWNNLENADVIEVGQVLRVIPPVGATAAAAPPSPTTASTESASRSAQPTAVAPAIAPSASTAASAAVKPTPPVAATSTPPAAAVSGDDDVGWIWPAQGALIAGFDDAKNKGLDIGGKAGDSVLAAADGRVVYAGAGLRGYGNLIILKHNNTFLTAYAHNRTLLVKEDQSVQKGQKIAEMGNSDSDRVKLHFEIRRQGKPVDPARYLPAR
ncbi:MAG: peptidoglycan DD-metalloendopeptidase family protein [Gammaproteobacteria bacterium]|nr:peptidoglycan DD-metalloendopeptidase family protein [Gammaproteobacteria bacterium]MBU1442548.1 peptidoglycan DD-metalloendopeptidase family protein [Gammaproteobacteria bacterium]MBU2409135.1 peptidoglycan DD-metalloendopeptidase family protein [Gammaproteobacteria bacterium]